MSLLHQIQSGVSPTGLRIVIGALEKMGKTTFCSGAPKALLIPLEVGYAGVSVDKVPMLTALDQFNTLIDEITQYAMVGQFPYQSLIIDSTTALERFIHDYIIALDPLAGRGGKQTITMDSAHGGYGKAYNLANEQFDLILKKFNVLAVQGKINIVLTSHVFSSKIVDPNSGEYDSWDLLLHSPKNMKTYGKREMLTQWADVIGFLYEPIFVNAEGKISRGISQNKGRVMGLSRTPGYTAGNRFGIVGEISIPAPPDIGWNAFAQALHTSCGIDIFTR